MKTNTKALLVAMSASVGLSAMAMTIEQAREQRQCVRGRFSVEGGLFDDTDEMRACLLREQDLAFARQRASDSLVRPVVEMFGRRGIRLMPLEERVAFASNFVSQARLSVKEANVVMSGLVDD